jgi:rhamnulose-1-phosphate aldolase/alcohol dehydrogenase
VIRDRWRASEARGLDGLGLLVHGSRLLGAEESLVLHGGGNTSLKRVETDHAGRRVRVMRVKGSGGDLADLGPEGFPGVRLDDLAPLRRRKDMTDAEMVAYLARCLVDPDARRPSIETLLHGFLPDAAVFHSHADAILALTNNPSPERHVRAALGERFVLVGYRRPGFLLSKMVAAAREASPGARGAVLLNHGLFTWAPTVEEAYRAHIAAVRRAEGYLARHRKARPFGPSLRRPLTAGEREGAALTLAPRLRGLLSTPERMVLRREDSPQVLSRQVLEFASSMDAARLCRIGPATPDHLLHTKRLPCFVPATDPRDPERTAREAEAAIREWSRSYERWVHRWNREGHRVEDLKPRAVIVRGLGLWTAGRDPRQARVVGDIVRHTIGIMAAAAGLGGFRSLTPREQFRAEYWELELYKRTLLPKEKELARRVAVITGAARGIGLGIAERFLDEGACVVLHDRDRPLLEAASGGLAHRHGDRVVFASGDVTRERDVRGLFLATVSAFGGVDIVVSNAGVAPAGAIDRISLTDWERSMAVNATGHFLVAREALGILKAQGTGGAFVFIASKNVPAPGKEFGAYSAAKAAETQLARVLALEGAPHGIRSNVLHPDAVFEGSALWSPRLRAERAKAQGIRAEDVPDFYRKRSLLGLEVRPRDVAEAALFFASDRSSRITGSWLPVDAGLKEAFPR